MDRTPCPHFGDECRCVQLRPGEYVITAQHVERLGYEQVRAFLDHINSDG